MRLKFTHLFVPLVALSVLAACQPTGPQSKIDYRQLSRERVAAILATCIETKCETLDLDSEQVADFDVLAQMSHVKVLMLSRSNFTDLHDIASMTQLTELHISNTYVKDLTGLGNFPNLNALHAASMPEHPDLQPIAAMTNLTELAVDFVKKDGIAYVAGLKSLQNFYIGYINIGNTKNIDLSPLVGHPELRRLSIEGILPEDRSALLKIPKLKKLTFQSSYVDPDFLDKLRAKGVEIVPFVILC